jgi:hypothetical protein
MRRNAKMRRNASHHRRGRPGMALVAALGLMMLAAGLLAGAAVASLGLQRASRTLAASARAETELRRSMGLVLQGWSSALDSLPVGATFDRAVPPVVVDGVPVSGRTHVQRLGPALYAATVTVQVGDSAASLALRQGRLLLTYAADTTTRGGSPGIRPLAPWSVVDLP